jgi:hypothetical protein
MFNMNTTNVVKGIANNIVGNNDTRATNQLWKMNSRNAKGRFGIDMNVSSAIAKNSPTPLSGFTTRPSVAVNVGTSSFCHHSASTGESLSFARRPTAHVLLRCKGSRGASVIS